MIAIPGMILINSAAFCPKIATFESILALISVDFSPESTGVTWLAPPSTTTVSLVVPTLSAILERLRLSPASKVMWLASHTLKPVCSTATVYVPGGTAAKVKYPSELATVRRTSAVASFVNVTFALGTTAPLGSVTVPVSAAVTFCAGRLGAAAINRTTNIASHNMRFKSWSCLINRPPGHKAFEQSTNAVNSLGPPYRPSGRAFG